MNPEQRLFHCTHVRSQAFKLPSQAPKKQILSNYSAGRAPGRAESQVQAVASDLGPWHRQPLVLRRWSTFLPTAQLQPGPCATHELLD